jgi:hypothetical protein
MVQFMEEHQEVPREDVTVKPVKELRKQRRGWRSTAWQCGEPKELTRGNWLPPAGCPTMQKWHDKKEASSDKFGPK